MRGWSFLAPVETGERESTVTGKQWDPDDVFDVLASNEARKILSAASVRSVSVDELEEICDASLPTIYRRINVLKEFGMLSEERVFDPEKGQYKQLTTDLEKISVVVENGGFNVNVEMRTDTVEKFGNLFRDLGEGTDDRSAPGFSDAPSDS